MSRITGPWLPVGLAALAMVATLPGRTHGLGLITEPLLAELPVGRLSYAAINLWATLAGALFCVPAGWLLDRLGPRAVLTALVAGLAAAVLLMSALPPGGLVGGVALDLFVLVLLTRGLGQSGLSVGSLALMGKASGRSGAAVGAYSFLVALGFMAAFALVRHALEVWHAGWRELWAGVGWSLLPLAALLLVLAPGDRPARLIDDAPGDGLTLRQALATPAFWVFALATSLYGLITAGLSLFNQAILAERGFARDVFLTVTAFSPLVGLAANLAGGWLAARWSPGRLLAVALALLAAALLAFPSVTTLAQVYAYAVALGVAGGLVTVIFFSVWGAAFGPRHLGQVQGAAQALTVVASALGPLLVAASHEATGSYAPLFAWLAAASLAFALAAWFVPLPAPAARREIEAPLPFGGPHVQPAPSVRT
jgi:MFS family permease